MKTRLPGAALGWLSATAVVLSALVSPSVAQSVYQGVFVTSNITSQPEKLDQWVVDAVKPPSVINFFVNWNDVNNTHKFLTSKVNAIRSRGAIPLITWQPQGAGEPDSNWTLQSILDGDRDAYINEWAAAAAAWGKPFFLRFAHEMNSNFYPWCGTTNGNNPAKYVAVWRKVYGMFQAAGATNATWIWCVNKHYAGSDWPLWEYYPGDQFVDWVAIDAYNRGTQYAGGTWYEFMPLINYKADQTYGAYDEIKRVPPTADLFKTIAPGKPIMISETGTAETGGSKAQWFKTALKNELKWNHPRIKAWIYFNLVSDFAGKTYDNRITSSTASRDAYRESIGLSYYTSNTFSTYNTKPISPLLSDETSVDAMAPFVSIVTPKSTTLPSWAKTFIKVSASDKSGINKVVFSVNGVDMFTDTAAPYEYALNAQASGTVYTVVARAYDNSPTQNSTISRFSFTAQ